MESHRAHRRARPPRRRSLLYTLLATTVIVGGTAAGTAYVKAQAHADAGTVSSSATPSASAPASEETALERVAEPSVDRQSLLAAAMKSVTVEDGADVSVAVFDLGSGESASYGDGTFDTASIVKVDILATLLLQAQDANRHLTAQEKTYATAMIEDSDNTSASALWTAIGQADGLRAGYMMFVV